MRRTTAWAARQPESASIWTTDLSPQAFFHEKVQEAQSRQGIMLSENVEFYIVNLLCDYVRVDEGKLNDDCLALILKKALESPSGEQIFLYKKLADTALYFSGFFQEYFNNKCFDIKLLRHDGRRCVWPTFQPDAQADCIGSCLGRNLLEKWQHLLELPWIF